MQAANNVQPHSDEAERSALGCMFISSTAAYLAFESLDAQDFYVSANKEIYAAMQSLNARKSPLDVVTVAEELIKRGTLEGVGGIPYITELSRFVPSAANADAYVRLVSEKSTLRKLISAAETIMRESYQSTKELPQILELSEKLIYDIAMRRAGEQLRHIEPTLFEVFDRIEKAYITKGAFTGVPSGYSELDSLTTGFHGGEFVLIGARPSMGKTSFAMNIVEHAAVLHRRKTAVFSLEMPREQLVMRMLCSQAYVDMQKVRHGNLSEDDWARLADAMDPLGSAPIFIDDTSGITVTEMRSRCRRMQIEQGLDLVVIDYLQLISASGNRRNDSRQYEISEISRMLKGLAQELKTPVITCSQLSRPPKGKADNRPLLSDLRDSGAIEQDADIVMFIYRDEYYNKETEDKNVAEIILAKQRNGPLGTVRLAWMGEYTKFLDPQTYRMKSGSELEAPPM